MKVHIYCDGASRGNPGPASFGTVAFKEEDSDYSLNSFKAHPQKCLFIGAEKLGVKTNNEAEYAALIYALKECLARRWMHPTILSDSQLVIRQMRGEYKVKDAKMRELFIAAQELARKVEPEFVHIPREKNQIADYLANAALDNHGSHKDHFAAAAKRDTSV